MADGGEARRRGRALLVDIFPTPGRTMKRSGHKFRTRSRWLREQCCLVRRTCEFKRNVLARRCAEFSRDAVVVTSNGRHARGVGIDPSSGVVGVSTVAKGIFPAAVGG